MIATTPGRREDHVFDNSQLTRYTEAIVHACLGLSPGDTLFVDAEPAHRELAVALAETAYAAGAALVDVRYADTRVDAARIANAAEAGLGPLGDWERRRFRAQLQPTAASVTILAAADLGVFDGLPPSRIAADGARRADRLRWFRAAARRGRRRWTGVTWPTLEWAALVYPDLDAAAGRRRLGEDLLQFCRLGPDDPPGLDGWRDHTDRLLARGRALGELDARRLELRGPGTELDVRLAEGTRWLGGPRANAFGRLVTPNFPTEENFTSPDARGTEGTFRCSRPRVLSGRVIHGIAGEFRGGRVVRLEADSDENRELLAAHLDSHPNARRLGEVALVDRSSRIGRTGRIYSNTLIDENAAAHIAFGSSFAQTRAPESGGRGLNRSTLHLDVMIGSDDLEATAVTADGRRVPLIAEGTWQI